MEEKPCRRGHGGETMEETSWRSNPGGHLEAEVPRSDPEAPQGLPRRHPGSVKEPPRIGFSSCSAFVEPVAAKSVEVIKNTEMEFKCSPSGASPQESSSVATHKI